jgi:competence protein ComEA
MSLQALPGVGPALAERIVTYRSENGLENPEDVQNVSGIGPKTYAGFKDMLCR